MFDAFQGHVQGLECSQRALWIIEDPTISGYLTNDTTIHGSSGFPSFESAGFTGGIATTACGTDMVMGEPHSAAALEI